MKIQTRPMEYYWATDNTDDDMFLCPSTTHSIPTSAHPFAIPQAYTSPLVRFTVAYVRVGEQAKVPQFVMVPYYPKPASDLFVKTVGYMEFSKFMTKVEVSDIVENYYVLSNNSESIVFHVPPEIKDMHAAIVALVGMYNGQLMLNGYIEALAKPEMQNAAADV